MSNKWLAIALLMQIWTVSVYAQDAATETVQIKDFDLVSTQKSEREKLKIKPLQQYLKEAEVAQGEKDYEKAAAIMDAAAEEYNAQAEDLIFRWRMLYHHKAGHYSKVIFSMYDKKPTDDYILLYIQADSYRKQGMFREAKLTIDRGIGLLPAEIEIPKKAPLSITNYREVAEKHLFLAGILLFAEQAMIQGDQLSQTKDAEALFNSTEKFWNLFPSYCERKLDDFYGFDLVDMAYYTAFKLYAEDDMESAKEMIKFYVERKRAHTSREKQQLSEATKLLGSLEEKK